MNSKIFCFFGTWLTLLFVQAKGNSQNWRCDDGSEIVLEWKCDGDIDCFDGSDESTNNCPLRECQFDEFQCASGLCIPQVLVCNGEVDCSIGGNYDNSDEIQNCNEIQTKNECDLTKNHLCSNGVCVSLSWLCDGVDDCGDGSDELNCTKPCLDGQVKCNVTSRCIDSKWVCDGEKDCVDGEDESRCETNNIEGATFSTRQQSRLCGIDEYACGTNCVMIEQLCDGKRDCSNDEDEGSFCLNNHTCQTRSDYSTWMPGRSSGVICDQQCRPSLQGPKCFCLAGYKLKQNGYSCKIKENGTPPKLFFSFDNEIRSITLHEDLSTEKIEFKNYNRQKAAIAALEFDEETGSLIWLERGSKYVYFMDSSRRKQVLFHASNVTSLSLDSTTRNMYFTYYAPQSRKMSVGVVSLQRYDDSREMIPMYELELKVTNPILLCVHSQLGKMIIVDQENASSKLIAADMDGKNSQVLVRKNQGQIRSVTVDYVTDIVYWSDVNKEEARINMIKMDGFGQAILLSSKNSEMKFSSPDSLAVFEDTLYFVDSLAHEIWAIDSLNGKSKNFANFHPVPMIKVASAIHMQALRISYSLLQRADENPCRLANCSHVCVLRPGGTSCLCPHGMNRSENNMCVDQQGTRGNQSRFISSSLKESLIPTQTTFVVNKTKLARYETVSEDSKNETKINQSHNVNSVSTFCSTPEISSSEARLLGVTNSSHFSVGTSIIYLCKEGHHIKGNPLKQNITLICLENGDWNSKLYPCNRFSCSSLECGDYGTCTNSSIIKGDICHCFDGSLSYFRCRSPSDTTTLSSANDSKTPHPGIGKFVAIGMILLLLTMLAGTFLWKLFKNSKKYLERKRQFRVSPIYKCSSETDLETVNIEAGTNKSDHSPNKYLLPPVNNSDDNDSGVDRSNSSLYSEGLSGTFQYQKLKQTADDQLERFESSNNSEPSVIGGTGNPLKFPSHNEKSMAMKLKFSQKRSESKEHILN